MKYIEILYLTATFISLSSSVPQIMQLIQTKKADEFNFFTWFVWMIGQLIATIYAFYARAYAYLLMSIIWTVFYAIMVVLIFKYRSKGLPYINRRNLAPKVCAVKFGPNFTPLNHL